MATLAPLQKTRLHEGIVEQLQEKILSGQFRSGDKLPPERDLAESLDVNRSTLREAFKKLEMLDLVEIRHGDGVYAKNYLESGNLDLIKAAIGMDEGHATLLNVLEARRFAVPEMACLAAQRRTPEDLAELEHAIFTADTSMLERDIKVHQLIARATHNLLCTIFLNFFNQIFRDYGHLYFDHEKNVARSQIFHREIFEAIKNRQPEEARRIMHDVLTYAEEAVKEALADTH